MRWEHLWNIFGGSNTPDPEPQPDPVNERLDEWAGEIEAAEYPQTAQVVKVRGLYEVSRTLRDRHGKCLAKIGFCKVTGRFYRTFRTYGDDA